MVLKVSPSLVVIRILLCLTEDIKVLSKPENSMTMSNLVSSLSLHLNRILFFSLSDSISPWLFLTSTVILSSLSTVVCHSHTMCTNVIRTG